jgi:hypothetical protein
MLNIYLDSDSKGIINYNDAFFNRFTATKMNYNKAKSIIEEIDDVKVLDDYFVVSKFTESAVGFDNLSTGCKTVLNVIFNQDDVFNACVCGENALNVIFRESVGNIYIRKSMLDNLIDLKCNVKVITNLGNIICKTTRELTDIRQYTTLEMKSF